MDNASLLNKLEQLLGLPREAATVELKLNWDHPKDIGEYLSALGNAALLERHDRAWLVWGVDNETHAVKGTHLTHSPPREKGTSRSSCG